MPDTEKESFQESIKMQAYDRPREKPDGMARQIVQSFRRNPDARVVVRGTIRADGKAWDLEDAFQATASSPLARNLKARHLQMIAIGGTIGAGLFLNTGTALATAGPASLIIAFAMVGTMVFCTVHALGEMAVLFPVAGSFSAYSTRFLDPAWGFAMGWDYALQWIAILPFEIVAATIAVKYWTHGSVSGAVWVTIYLLLIFFVNCFSVRVYGEVEFVFTSLKILAILGFIIFGIVMNCGGTPGNGYIGGAYWHDPGAFNNGFKGLCSVFVTAAFSFVGTEMVGLCSAETRYPRQSIPPAVRQTFWRITLFYILALLMIGLNVKHTDPALTGQAGTSFASPFVIAIKNAGVRGLDSVINAVIMFTALECGNSAVYASSRTLAALAEQHQAPAIFAYIDRSGRPLVAIMVTLVFGFFSYLAASPVQDQVLLWFTAIGGLAGIFTWGSICLVHIRFRRAWRLQGHSLDELAFRSSVGVYGSWFGLIFNIVVLFAQFWISFAPVGYRDMSGSKRATNFFQGFLAFPIVVVLFVGYKWWFRTKIIRARDMNLYTGVLELNLQQILAEERATRAKWPLLKRWYHMVC